MKFVPNAVSRKIARQILTTQKHSPTILFAAGVVGVVGGTVLACQSTLKLDKVLHEAKDGLDTTKMLRETAPDRYSEEDRKKDVAVIYGRTAMQICKLYGPAIIVGVAGISALTSSHRILTKRNAALTAAYAGLEKAFKEYRDRIAEEFGEEKERDIYRNVREVEVTDDAGKKQKVKRSKGAYSIYAKFFGPDNKNWSVNPDLNLLFIRCQQNTANDLLKARGHVFLNDVYDSLGIDRTPEGAVTGWLWNSKDGDNYVDFGIFTGKIGEEFYEFAVGREGVWLDFNVDGVIYDKI